MEKFRKTGGIILSLYNFLKMILEFFKYIFYYGISSIMVILFISRLCRKTF